MLNLDPCSYYAQVGSKSYNNNDTLKSSQIPTDYTYDDVCAIKNDQNEEKSIDELLSRFSEEEKNSILSCVNEYNEDLLDEVLQLSYFNGTELYPSTSVKLILNQITKSTQEKAREILSQNLEELDYLAYELAMLINPKYKSASSERDSQGDVDDCQEVSFDNPPCEGMSEGKMPDDVLYEMYSEILYGKYTETTKALNSGDPKVKRTKEECEAYEELIYETFKDEFKDIYLEESTDEECIKLENEMAEMGVRVTFANNLEDAKAIVETYKMLYDMGYELPKEVILVDFNSNKLGLTLRTPNGTSKYAPIFYQVGISNNNMKAYDALQTQCDTMGISWYSTDDPSGIISHEVGHYNQKETSFYEKNKIWKEESEPNLLKICKEVSGYAAVGNEDNADEFVAEVFAGLVSGKEYSDYIMQLYYTLGGVWK